MLTSPALHGRAKEEEGMKATATTLARLIKKMRKAEGVTQPEIAGVLGYTVDIEVKGGAE